MFFLKFVPEYLNSRASVYDEKTLLFTFETSVLFNLLFVSGSWFLHKSMKLRTFENPFLNLKMLILLKCSYWNLNLPLVHVAVDHGIVHGVRHGQPVDHQVNLLDVVAVVDIWVDVCSDEVCVIRQPANNEDQHNHHHHFYNLHNV